MDDHEREARDRELCEVAINASTPPPGIYCAGTFDTWTCWPHTPAGRTAFATCPAFVPGFSPNHTAHKECETNGTWFMHPDTHREWSNYTQCLDFEDYQVRTTVMTLYEAGYSISLVALLLSLAILTYFKSLHCARITIHMNLFGSFAVNNLLWLVWYTAVLRRPEVLYANPFWCRALHVVTQYAMASTYTWTVCEGLYLHTLLASAFVAERRLLRALLAAGWLAPVVAVALYAGLRGSSDLDADTNECWMNEECWARGVLAAVVVGSLVLNLIFLCNIVRVLCRKLRAAPHQPRPPSATALQAFRATCLLVPLLGLHYLLTPFRPESGAPGSSLYEYVSAVTTSLQGFCVATLFCFCNGEVIAQIKRKWRALMFRPRANSCTATTVSPLCRQFVRSAAPGEEKL